MQLIASDGRSHVSALRAEKGKDYVCPECGSLLRLKSGPSKQRHFFHPARSLRCRQSEKSLEHLHLQMRLEALTGGEVECPFPAINRIADVAWHKRKIIFEIQCSPIALEEVKARNEDYRSAGYEVIWILHDKRFNRANVSASEHYLRSIPCYFTNCNRDGKGVVYDQFEVLKDSRRLFKGPSIAVDLLKLASPPEISPDGLPNVLLRRLKSWKWHAENDLLGRFITAPSKQMLQIEARFLKEELVRLPWHKLLAGTYRSLLDFLLKKSR